MGRCAVVPSHPVLFFSELLFFFGDCEALFKNEDRRLLLGFFQARFFFFFNCPSFLLVPSHTGQSLRGGELPLGTFLPQHCLFLSVFPFWVRILQGLMDPVKFVPLARAVNVCLSGLRVRSRMGRTLWFRHVFWPFFGDPW